MPSVEIAIGSLGGGAAIGYARQSVKRVALEALIEECAQHQLDNGLLNDAAKSFEMAFQASTTDVDPACAHSEAASLHAARRGTDYGVRCPAMMGGRRSISPRSVSRMRNAAIPNLNSSKPEADAADLESDIGALPDRLACARGESAPVAHRATGRALPWQ